MGTVTPIRRTPPANATLGAIAHLESENVGGEMVDTLVYDWTGAAPMFVTERVELELESEHRDQVVLPADFVRDQAPGFDVGYLLRFQRLGTCRVRRVTDLEDRSDFGFIRTWTTPTSRYPDGEPDPCAP